MLDAKQYLIRGNTGYHHQASRQQQMLTNQFMRWTRDGKAWVRMHEICKPEHQLRESIWIQVD